MFFSLACNAEYYPSFPNIFNVRIFDYIFGEGVLRYSRAEKENSFIFLNKS